MDKLTQKETQVFEFIAGSIRENGYAPSVRDIRDACGIKSTATVHDYIARLEKKGCLTRSGGKSRAIGVVGQQRDPSFSRRNVRVPLVGRIRAGMPILAVENYESYIDFPIGHRYYGNDELFALRVTGSSMIGAGIFDGDVVVVRRTPDAPDGTIVVALIDDEATLKTFYRENGRIRLQPENPDMDPIIVDDCLILGRVAAVLRYY